MEGMFLPLAGYFLKDCIPPCFFPQPIPSSFFLLPSARNQTYGFVHKTGLEKDIHKMDPITGEWRT